MRSLARFILAGPFQAVTVVFGFALLSFPFPFLIILSGGALALITLKIGVRQAVKVLLICAALVAASTFLLFGNVTAGPLIVWGSIVVFAYVYHYFQSLSAALQALTVFGMVITVLAMVLYPDLQADWLHYLKILLAAIEQGPSFHMLQNSNLNLERAEQYLPGVASLMTGMVVGVYLLTISVTLFLGSWWHSLVDNVHTFREQFVRLNLGPALAALTLVLAGAAWIVKTAIFWQLAIICLSMFFLQGLGLAHAVIGQLSKSVLGFVAVYGLLVIAAPQMVLILASTGVLDGFVNFRKRFVKSGM